MKITLLLLIFTLTLSAQTIEPQKVEVYFEFDRYELSTAAIEKLDDYIANKNLEVSKIYGYCDWKGSNAYNDSLSLKRVNEVYWFLKEKGMNIKEGYERKGFGEDFNQSRVQSENRKVTVVFENDEKKITTINNDLTLTSQMKLMKPGDKIKLKNINFHNNSAVIVSKSKPILYELLCIMEENPKLKIQIQGHICCQPVSDINNVSTSRARAIYNFLIRNKIDRKRISYKGFGITQPIHPIPEKTDEEANENRRVEIMIVEN